MTFFRIIFDGELVPIFSWPLTSMYVGYEFGRVIAVWFVLKWPKNISGLASKHH